MKRLALLCVLGLASGAVFGLPGSEPGYFSAEVKAVGAEMGDRSLGELKVGELVPLVGRLDVARQKDGYVRMASGFSMVWPGAGQFLTGDVVNGTLFTVGHVAVTAASLYWAHSLLPSDLQWSNLNYFSASHDTVKGRWSAHSLEDYLPALGAAALGGAVDFALRAWSARGAHDDAKAAIDDGKVTFEPQFGGRMGLGLGFGMRW